MKTVKILIIAFLIIILAVLFLKIFNKPSSMPETFFKEEKICQNLCGDGQCQEIVCMAVGCPCAESANTCPQDCE
ncbi:MAG: hypothetical protein Athens101410_327 [Parcubacteria group bacterium Athens1014_10]|nr:MAG: hypothetical protein Athens101410_327 [Parcubacteria group bacterium Athens1014_10]TSD04218.1 MAG: hypothetical protein Athens071412_782 [Parcubacteria group bacterium Athens0714_12]